MDYYCEVCQKYINHNSKYLHLISKSHEKFNKCKNIILSIFKRCRRDIDLSDVDGAFYLYIIEH